MQIYPKFGNLENIGIKHGDCFNQESARALRNPAWAILRLDR